MHHQSGLSRRSMFAFFYKWLSKFIVTLKWRLYVFRQKGSDTALCFELVCTLQDCRYCPNDLYYLNAFSGMYCILIQILLKFVAPSSNDNGPALIRVMAWHRTGAKPLLEPMMITFSKRPTTCHRAPVILIAQDSSGRWSLWTLQRRNVFPSRLFSSLTVMVCHVANRESKPIWGLVRRRCWICLCREIKAVIVRYIAIRGNTQLMANVC